MRRAIACCALSAALLAGVPALAFADDADQDTLTEVVEVAVEGDETIDESPSSESASPSAESPSASSESPSASDGSSTTPAGTKGAPSSTATSQRTPSTGDQLMNLVIPCIIAAVAALVALGAAVAMARSRKKE